MMQFPDLPGRLPESPIEFHFEGVKVALPDEQTLKAWILDVAAAEQKPFIEVHYIFCTDEHLGSINLQYLQHDYFTDVITFPYADDSIYGDIFISSERVSDNAANLGVSFQHELCRVMIHGILHLAGYTDETPESEQLIRAKEDEYLKRFFGT